MILYLVSSTACLALLLAVYLLLLEKERMYRFNRFYLLFSLAFSLLIPLLTLNEQRALMPYHVGRITSGVETGLQQTASLPLWYVVRVVYVSIALFFLIRLLRNAWTVVSRASRSDRLSFHSAQLVLLDGSAYSYTFWNYIFVDAADYLGNKIEKEILCHELAHAKQKHTLDILLIELLQAIFWFNPVFRFYKRAMQLNHEFLADEAVVLAYNSPKYYQLLLLKKVTCNSRVALGSSFNYLVTKKRLCMLSAHGKSRRPLLLKKLLLLPVVLLSIFLFSARSGSSIHDVNRPGQQAHAKPVDKNDQSADIEIELELDNSGNASSVTANPTN